MTASNPHHPPPVSASPITPPDPSGIAEPQLGASPPAAPSSPPAASRGWYSRGYLPHCDFPGILQSITYRLADSLPSDVVKRLLSGLESLPEDRRDMERRRRLEAWLDAGHGSCALRDPAAAGCVVETWRRFAPERYDLIAWVVMPNHVHVLIRVREGWELGKIVQSWKSYTGRRIGEIQESREGRAGARRAQEEGRAGARRAQGGRAQGVWMREYWDRFIRDERHFAAVVDYIHQNPVKAGLVERSEDWMWSSAKEWADASVTD